MSDQDETECAYPVCGCDFPMGGCRARERPRGYHTYARRHDTEAILERPSQEEWQPLGDPERAAVIREAVESVVAERREREESIGRECRAAGWEACRHPDCDCPALDSVEPVAAYDERGGEAGWVDAARRSRWRKIGAVVLIVLCGVALVSWCVRMLAW